MRLLDALKPAASLLLSLSRDLFARSPVILLSTVGAGVIAQLARMLAFLLPLKIVLLASSNTVPSYMRRVPGGEQLSLESWISLLVLVSVICYIASVSLEGVISKLQSGLSIKIVNTAPAHVENRDKSVPYILRQVHVALVALSFLIIATVAVSTVMAMVAGVMVVTVCLMLALSVICYEQFSGFRQALNANPKQFVAHISSAVFLIGFSAVLFGVLVGPGVPAIKALMALILLRICTNMLQALWSSGKALYDRESEASQLFLGKKISHTTSSRDQYEKWLASSEGDAQFIVDCMGELAPPGGVRTWAWLGNSGRVSRTIVLIDQESRWSYAIRSVTGARLSGVSRYRTVERDLVAHELVPPPVGVGQVGRFHSLVFDIREYGSSVASPELQSEWAARLWSVMPDADITGSDVKTRGKWHETLSSTVLTTISVGIATESGRLVLRELASRWSVIVALLDTLPVCYAVPASSELLVSCRRTGRLANLAWEDWMLLPVGVVLSATRPKFDMALTWESAAASRPLLSDVSMEMRKLAALSGRFVAYHRRGDYAELPALAAEMLSLLDSSITDSGY